MWHLLAYAGSALDATAGDVQVNAVPDQMFRVQNNSFVMPSDTFLIGGYAGGATLTRARFSMPSFRIPSLPQIVPINAALAVPTNSGFMDFRNFPLRLKANEELRVDATNGVANTVIAFGIVSDQIGQWEPPNLELRWARFTATIASTALTWSPRAEITFQDVLQSGIYGVYGLIASGTTQLATRLIFNNQAWRPGIIGAASADIVPPSPFLKGFGEWGEFENSVPPGLEVFNSAAGVTALVGAMLIGLKRAQ